MLSYYWEDNVNQKRWKICAPKALQQYVLWHLHDSPTGGHQGISRTQKRAKLCPFYWPNMNLNVKDYVHTYDICEERKQPPRRNRQKMKSYVMGARFERLASDIAGPFPVTERGNRYILIIEDYFTKFTEVYPLTDMNAETVVNVFLRGWIKRYGCPVLHPSFSPILESPPGKMDIYSNFLPENLVYKISPGRNIGIYPVSPPPRKIWYAYTYTNSLPPL